MDTVWQVVKESLESIGENVAALSWPGKVELCVLVVAGSLIIARQLRNQRFPAQFRELARQLGARRPSWWASHHRPSLQGWFQGVKVLLDFVDRGHEEVTAPIWIVLRLQAPPDISGRLRYAEQEEVLERLSRQLPAESGAILEARRAIWDFGGRLGQGTVLGCSQGWAEVNVESHWDADELRPAALMRLIAGTVSLLRLIAVAQRRQALEDAPRQPAPVAVPLAREDRGERQAERVREAEEEVQRGDALDGAGGEGPARAVA